jgi:hypothetical protein
MSSTLHTNGRSRAHSLSESIWFCSVNVEKPRMSTNRTVLLGVAEDGFLIIGSVEDGAFASPSMLQALQTNIALMLRRNGTHIDWAFPEFWRSEVHKRPFGKQPAPTVSSRSRATPRRPARPPPRCGRSWPRLAEAYRAWLHQHAGEEDGHRITSARRESDKARVYAAQK